MNPQNPTRIFTPKLILGLALIALGLILTLDQFGWPGAWGLFRFWPVVPAMFGLARLRQRGWTHLGGHAWLAFALVGLAVQCGREDLLDRWWPVLVIWGGAILTLRALVSPAPKPADSCDAGSGPAGRKP